MVKFYGVHFNLPAGDHGQFQQQHDIVGMAIFPESPEVVLHVYCYVSIPFSLLFFIITSRSPAVLIVLAHSHTTETSHLLLLLVFVCRTILWHTSDVCHPKCDSEVC